MVEVRRSAVGRGVGWRWLAEGGRGVIARGRALPRVAPGVRLPGGPGPGVSGVFGPGLVRIVLL